MSENNINDGDSIQQLLDLNHKISHNLQTIMLLLNKAENMTNDKVEMLAHHSDELIHQFSRFRAHTYSLIGLDETKYN
jgi:hypothetical protein